MTWSPLTWRSIWQPDAAVGTDGADHLVGRADRLRSEALLGDELEDRAGGADPDALAAPGAAGVIGIAVAADDDLGMLAPHPHVEDPDLLDVLAGPHAAGAEDAGAHVVLDHHVAGALVAGAERELVVVADGDIVLGDVALELVAGPFATAVLEVLARIALEQQAEHASAIVYGRRRLGLHHHAFGGGRGARGQELALALDRHQADAAVPHDGQLGVPAERRDVDAGSAGGLQNGGAGLEGDVTAVDGNPGHCAPMFRRREVI